MAHLHDTKAKSDTPSTVIEDLIDLLPKLPNLKDLGIPSMPLEGLAKLSKHQEFLQLLQHAETEKHNPDAPKIETLLKEILNKNDTYKLLGLDKVSDKKINEAADAIRTLSSNYTSLDKKDLTLNLSIIASNLVSELPKEDRLVIINKISEEGLTLLGISPEGSKTYSKLISTLVTNADPRQLNNAIEFAIKTSFKHSSEISPKTVATIYLKSPAILAKEIGMSEENIKLAQTCIADSFKASLLEQSRASNVPINIHALNAVLNPNTPYALVDKDGNYNAKNLSAVASSVSNNILNNPQTHEEHSLRNQAHQEREAAHQNAVRQAAHQQIQETRFGIFNRPHRRRQAHAHAVVNQWSPGHSANGFIGRRVTREVNDGYNNSRGQADSEIRKEVFAKTRDTIHSSLSSLSKEDRVNLSIISSVLNHGTDKGYATNIRVDDLNQLQSLGKVAKNILENNPAKELDPTRVSDYVTRHGTNGDKFDLFKDTKSDTNYYRLTNKNGSVRYAKAVDEGKYVFIDANEHSGVIKSLELYEQRLAKGKPENTDKVANL
jgi:hypothetical protein